MIMFFAEEGGEVQDFVSPLNFYRLPLFLHVPGTLADHEKNPHRIRTLARMSHKFSTALRNIRLHVLRRDKTGADADFVGFASLQGVDPASPANLHKTRASTRSPFARYEFCEKCGLA